MTMSLTIGEVRLMGNTGSWGTTQVSSSRREPAAKAWLPSTWEGRKLGLEHRGPDGSERMTSGNFLDTCALGLIVASGDARTVIAWDSLSTVELPE